MKKFQGSFTSSLESVKRCYIDVVFEDCCPRCGEISFNDLNKDYISYPEENEIIHMYCSDCDDTWEVPVKIEAIITITKK